MIAETANRPGWEAISAVLFDFDYTLADSSTPIIACINHALAAMGRPAADEARCRACIGLSLADTWRVLTEEAEPESAEVFSRHFIDRADEIMVAQTVLYPFVPEMAAHMQDRGLKLGVVSTKFRRRIAAVLTREGLFEAFNVVVGGEDVVLPKPDPEGLLLAAERCGIAPAHTLYVGDSTVDSEAAARAGMRFAAVLTGVTPAGAFDGSALAILPTAAGLTHFLV